ncbi:hypothetical protein Tc00.1047053508221.850 [Trypanosoma cruzi]|uniref:Uncharacterized protein n=1 Tax=Trypanosoma cruzi (strain CL Brener) TaxID=353153 RepID=Q4E5T8_TRYCC|nr:hypothetical protein Tc00.1047053508221.850 [Trypanosoma cruzi]EAO00174.1 hypothetical protein Tc00.1047053508221.850 [Trypanosoma cruzi]|eukprot:XP_822025.1 hypothetical protein [Trypanosoma cruzi strain CL Brener]
MRHPCTVVVVVTVILFSPTGVREVSLFTCTMCWIPLWALRAWSGTMASLQELSRVKSGGPFVVQLVGDGCGSLLLLVFGGCSVVVCVFPVWMPFCSACSVRVVPAAGGRIITAHATATLRRCVCVCVCLFAAPLSISPLPFSSPLCAQICLPTSATLILIILLLLLLARVRGKR